MNIAMLISRYPPVLGGSEIQCQRLSYALLQRGHAVSVLTEKSPGSQTDADDQGVRVLRLGHAGGPRIFQAIHYFNDAIHYLQTHPPFDVLHAHLIATPAMAALWYGRQHQIPVVVKAAGARATGDVGTSLRTLRGRLKLRIFKHWANTIICPSQEIRKELTDLSITKETLHVIPNGIDTEQWHPLRREDRIKLREELKLGEGPWLVCASRYARGKGIDHLIRFFKTHGTESGWKLLLLLTFPPEQEVKFLFNMENIPSSIRILRNPPEARPYIQSADAAILFSEGEGLSNFLLEAMASGLPVLCSDAAAPENLSGSPRWGWTYNLQSDWMKELLTWMRNEGTKTALLDEKGKAGRQFIEARYSMISIAQQYETLYQETIAKMKNGFSMR